MIPADSLIGMRQQRNMVVILGHGLRSDVIGDSDAWILRTPSLEKLARKGVRLVANSACPADPGGMASLLTAMHARQHGYLTSRVSPVEMDGWPALLGEAGYRVAGVGCVGAIEKWLHESVVVDDVAALDSSGCRYLSEMRGKGLWAAVTEQRKQRLRCGPFEPDRLTIEPDDDVDGFILVKARQMMAGLPADKPWVLIVALTGPGNDLPPPRLYDHIVDADELQGGFTPVDFREVDNLASIDYPRVMLQRLNASKIGRIRADYLGRVSLIDHGIGQMMSRLEDRPDRERTWVVVSSDHGQLLGEHGLVGHQSFLAPSVEVPAIITPPVPVRPRGKDTIQDCLVSTVDVAATIAALGGCDLPAAVAGRSLLPMLRGEPFISGMSGAGGVISEYNGRLLFESERYKVVFDVETRAALGLYDMLDDVEEKENMLATAAGQNILDSLRWRLCEALLPLRSPNSR